MPYLTNSNGVDSSRREFLKTGAAVIGSLALPSLALQTAAGAAISAHSNKSVLFVFLAGGPSQLDMYDMKPDAPANIRGEFRPIYTNVPGMHVCEHLPLHASIADKFSIVNGIETIDTHSQSVVVSGFPSSHERPNFAQVASTIAKIDSFEGRDVFKVSDEHEPQSYLHGALKKIEQGAPAIVTTLPRALPTRSDWDTHGRVLGGKKSIFQELRATLPIYDQAICGVISAIYDRGLDKDVLLVVCGEFGRTPWINRHGGRDHWAPCGSVLFAGGGLKMGQVIGNTGPIGEREYCRSKPYTAQNVLATIYRHLGVDPAMAVRDGFGRMAPLLDDRRAIEELV